jgi:hypothetical protein
MELTGYPELAKVLHPSIMFSSIEKTFYTKLIQYTSYENLPNVCQDLVDLAHK